MEGFNFKFKEGDVVVITRNSTWPDYSSKPKRICVILGTMLSYCRWCEDGPVGEKHPFYNLTYDLGMGHFNKRIDHDATDETIKLLEEYWYIDENLEVCKETNVKLDTKFIHRANSFGVYLTEYEANSTVIGFKHKNFFCDIIK